MSNQSGIRARRYSSVSTVVAASGTQTQSRLAAATASSVIIAE